jgi:hypothetical protein
MKRTAKAKTKTKTKGTRKIRGGEKKDVLPSVAKIIKHHPKIGVKNAKIQNAIITIHAFDPDTQGGKVQIKPEMMKQLRSALQYIQTNAPAGDLTRVFVDLVSDELPYKFEVLSPSQSSLLDRADKAAAVEDARSTQKSVKAALKAAIKSPSGYSSDGYASPGDSQNPLRSRSRSNRR